MDVKFKDQYDEYLKALGQNQLFRNIAKSIVGNTLEELELVENDDANNGDPHLRVKVSDKVHEMATGIMAASTTELTHASLGAGNKRPRDLDTDTEVQHHCEERFGRDGVLQHGRIYIDERS